MAMQVYAPQQFDPSAFATDPLGSAMGGFNAIQNARAKQQEMEAARAKMLLEQQMAPAKLDFARAEAEQMRASAAGQKRMNLDELAKLAKTNPALALQQAREMGLDAKLEEVYDQSGPPSAAGSPGPGGPSMPPPAQAQGAPPAPRPTEDDLFPESGGPQDLSALMQKAASGGGAPSAPDLQRPPSQAPSPAGVSPPSPASSLAPAAGATPQGNLLGYRLRANIGGQDVVLHDPLQEREAQRRQANEGAAAFTDQKYAQRFRALVGAGIPAPTALKQIDDEAKQAQKDAEKEAADLKYKPDITLQDKWHRQHDAALANSRPSAEDRINTNTRADMSFVERAHENIKRSSSYKTLLTQGQSLKAAADNLSSENPLRQADGLQQLTKFYHGGVATQGTMDQINGHLAGKVDDLGQFWTHITDGTYGPEQLKNLRDAVTEANKTQERNIDAFTKGVRKGMGPGNGFDAYGNRVNNMVKSDLLLQGLDQETVDRIPDLYESGDAALGSGKRPGRNPVVAARAAEAGKRAGSAPAASESGWRKGKIDGKPAKIYPDGSFEAL